MRNEIGMLRRVTIAATAGNVAYTLRSTQYQKMKLLSLRLTLVCDANVANRNIQFVRRFSSGSISDPLVRGQNITAGNTGYLALSPFSVISGASFPNDTDYVFCPEGLWIAYANNAELSELYININNGVAGDSYSGFGLALEFPV